MAFHKREIITSIEVKTLEMAWFDDFITLSDKKYSAYVLKEFIQKGDRLFNAFSLNGLYVVLRGSNSLHKNLTIRQLLYIYYHYLFGVAMYIISEKNRQPDGNTIEHCYLINEYAKHKMELSPSATISKVDCWHKDEDSFKKLKKTLKWFAPKKSYDKKEEDNWKTILRTGEIFEYLVATSKIPSPVPSYDTIRKAILENGGRSDFSNQELDSQMDSVRKLLTHTI